MHLFYLPETDGSDALVGSRHLLPEEEAAHALRVLRLGEGDEVYVTNGKGLMLKAVVAEASKRRCLVEVLDVEENYGHRNFRLHMAVAPTKNIKRFEWFLEKATEMGIDEITPLICRHSERRELKVQRSVKVITAAMKQSLKAYHPLLNDAVPFELFIDKCKAAQRFIARYEGKQQLLLRDGLAKGGDVVVLIGPEGDFSADETHKAKLAGFIPVSLGNTRLRTETAALVSVFTVNLINL